MRSFPRAVALLLLPIVVSAIDLVLSVSPNQLLPNPGSLPSSTRATIHATNITRTAFLTRANTFRFTDLTPQSYLVSIQARDFYFVPLRVDVVESEGKRRLDAWQTYLGNEWSNKGEHKGTGDGNEVVVEVKPQGAKDYYMARAGFSPLDFLKNPMILMAVLSLVLIVGLPKLMENMDDETRAEFEEMQKQGTLGSGSATAATQSIQNFDVAGWLAGSGKSSAATSSSDAGAGATKRK